MSCSCCSVNIFKSQYTYSALMDIPGLEDTQMVDGSKTILKTISQSINWPQREHTTWFYLSTLRTNKITHRCFTYRVCMEPAEVIFVVDRQSFQEISLWTQQKNMNKNTSCQRAFGAVRPTPTATTGVTENNSFPLPHFTRQTWQQCGIADYTLKSIYTTYYSPPCKHQVYRSQ